MTIRNDPKTYLTRAMISRGRRIEPTKKPRPYTPEETAAISAAWATAITESGYLNLSKILKDHRSEALTELARLDQEAGLI